MDDLRGTIWRIEPAKITLYLLNPAHTDGGSKDKFLRSFGFDPAQPEILASSLAEHGMTAWPGREFLPPKGLPRLVFEGALRTPDGRMPVVRTVWERVDSRALRFVTLVPLTRGRGSLSETQLR